MSRSWVAGCASIWWVKIKQRGIWNLHLMNSIGQIIKERRKELGLTQNTLALLSQVGINTIVSIERGSKSPSIETLTKVADVLGLEVKLEIK